MPWMLAIGLASGPAPLTVFGRYVSIVVGLVLILTAMCSAVVFLMKLSARAGRAEDHMASIDGKMTDLITQLGKHVDDATLIHRDQEKRLVTMEVRGEQRGGGR
jgi:hypothetical protein